MRGRTFWFSILLGGLLLALPFAASASDDKKVPGTDKTAAEWIDVLSKGKETRLRRVALIALSFAGPKTQGVFPAVNTALQKDPEKIVRIEAARWLASEGIKARRLENKLSITPSVDALGKAVSTDKEPDVRAAAAASLTRLAGVEDDVLLLQDLKEQVVPLSKALIADENVQAPQVQVAIADFLGELGEHAGAATDALRLALVKSNELPQSTDREQARIQIIHAIGRMGSFRARSAVGTLIGILKDKKSTAKELRQTAQTLGVLKEGAAEASQELSKLLSYDPKTDDAELLQDAAEVRRYAALALDQIGTGAIPVLPTMIEKMTSVKTDKFVRCHLLHAVGELGEKLKDDKEKRNQALDALIKCSGDNTSEVRLTAVIALGELGSIATEEHVAKVDKALRAAAMDAREQIRQAALASLLKLGSTDDDE